MYDTVTLDDLHGLAMDAAAGYVDGYTTWPDLPGHVPPGTILMSITARMPPKAADCVDIEPERVWPISKGVSWTKDRLARGVWRPVVYTGASNGRAVLAELGKAGISRGQIRFWTAHYAGQHFCGPATCGYLDSPADGTQWTQAAHGRNLDQSTLANWFFDGPAAAGRRFRYHDGGHTMQITFSEGAEGQAPRAMIPIGNQHADGKSRMVFTCADPTSLRVDLMGFGDTANLTLNSDAGRQGVGIPKDCHCVTVRRDSGTEPVSTDFSRAPSDM
jgi:hypothetical protein